MRCLNSIAMLSLALMGIGPALCGQDSPPPVGTEMELRGAALQAKVSTLPEAKVNVGTKHSSFQVLDLAKTRTTVNGTDYYAFRFTTPSKPLFLMWSFRREAGMTKWDIIAAKGQQDGFVTFDMLSLPRDLPDIGKKGDEFVLQSYDSPPTNTEYIIWFASTEPVKVTASLNFVARPNDVGFGFIFPSLADPEPTQPVPEPAHRRVTR